MKTRNCLGSELDHSSKRLNCWRPHAPPGQRWWPGCTA